jgi:enoyl-CoA hydratase/carnithine racemase
LVEREGAIVTLTLNRPEIRNAMDPALTEAFSGEVDRLRADPDVRAVVITGAGRAFCAGGDLSWIRPGPEASVPDMR